MHQMDDYVQTDKNSVKMSKTISQCLNFYLSLLPAVEGCDVSAIKCVDETRDA